MEGQGNCKLTSPFFLPLQTHLCLLAEMVKTRNMGCHVRRKGNPETYSVAMCPVYRASLLSPFSLKPHLPAGRTPTLRPRWAPLLSWVLPVELFLPKHVQAQAACKPKESSLVTPLLKQPPIRPHLMAPPIWLSVQHSTMHGNSPRHYSCFSHPQNKERGIMHDWKLATKC